MAGGFSPRPAKKQDIEALEAGFRSLLSRLSRAASIEALVRDVMELTGGRLDALYNNGAHAQAEMEIPVEPCANSSRPMCSAGSADLTRRDCCRRRCAHRGMAGWFLLLDTRPDAGVRNAYCASSMRWKG